MKLANIIVPVDMSEASANALEFAWRMAEIAGADIEVLHVMDKVLEGQQTGHSGMLSQMYNSTENELHTFVEETIRGFGGEWPIEDRLAYMPEDTETKLKEPIVRIQIAYGLPDVVIKEMSNPDNLVVMSTTGRSALGSRIFGSICTEVSKNAPGNILFVPSKATFGGFDHVLYASNAASLGYQRIQQAVSFAGYFDSQIHFVHVGHAGEEGVDLEKRLFEIEYKSLNPRNPFLYTRMIEDENIAASLMEYALFHRIELMIFVTAQRHFWEDVLHNSVTQQVLHSNEYPMLVIHAEKIVN
jgi:nucleotide-binding universal stress UspA family protein